MKLLAFAASNSTQSINKKLATYAVSLLDNVDVEILDLNDYELPIFSVDQEQQLGHPELAQEFFNKIGQADALIISFAEHNGSYSVAYKNIFDWCSRINAKVYQGKPMVLLSTSPGPGGAGSVLAAATNSMKFFDGDVKGSLSVPSFFDNFDVENGVVSDQEIKSDIQALVEKLST